MNRSEQRCAERRLRKRREQYTAWTAAEGSGVFREDDHFSMAMHQQVVAATASGWGHGESLHREGVTLPCR